MNYKTLGIDIGSTTVKIAILDENENLIFADYKRHFANIQETLADLLQEAFDQYGEMTLHPVITGSGGLTLANLLGKRNAQMVGKGGGKIGLDLHTLFRSHKDHARQYGN